MLGLIPNFLSRLRKKRRWCAFFSTASVWADNVRSSVMWMQRNLKLFTRSTGVLSMVMGVCSLLGLLKSTTSSLVLSMLSWEVVLLTPFSQGTHLFSVGRLIAVSDQAYHRCVVSKFDDDVGAVCGCTGSTGVVWERSPEEHQCWGSVEMRCCCPFWPPDFCLSGSLGSSCTEICSVPESGASQPVWQALWCLMLNFSPRTAFSHRCSYFPGGREQCVGWRQ